MKNRRLIDIEAYLAEEEAIEQLKDRGEARRRLQLLREIEDKALAYSAHIRQYEYEQHCKAILRRGLRVSPVKKAPVAAKWDKFFAAGLSKETRRKIYFEQFKWHMFSYGQVEAIAGAAAREAFDRQNRGEAYLFIQCTDEAWHIENAGLLTAADLGSSGEYHVFLRADVYLFDAQGKWTYCRTHESDCGPWFLQVERP